MSDPLIILSDEDDLDDDPLLTPIRFLYQSKKPRTEFEPDPNPIIPTVVLIDDDPTPQKPGPTSNPAFVPDTPMSVVAKAKSTASNAENKSSGNQFVCLESDNEDGFERENWKEIGSMDSGSKMSKDLDWSTFIGSTSTVSGHADAMEMAEDHLTYGPTSLLDDVPQIHDSPGKENDSMDEMEDIELKETEGNNKKRRNASERMRKKMMTEEEKLRLKEEKKTRQLQEKLRKQALKAEAAKLKKAEREKRKWENGKSAVKSIVAEIDKKVIEMGLVGGNLLTRLGEKGIKYRVTSNPIERSILWTMHISEDMPELSQDGLEIRYILLVYEAEEFCNLATNESLFDHVFEVQSRYPSHTVCYLTNRLMSYVNKREQEQYKSPTYSNCWTRPPVEEVLAKLVTRFNKVHSRQCVDEAEVAEHVVGLTLSLASCLFRKKLTRLSVNANGSLIPKDSTDKRLIKNNLWLKVLVAIPKVQPRFAVAIWKKYPTMKSLLKVYMDPTKSVHEKEFFLKDLKIEGLLGEDRRLGEVCSKRLYRILMANNGSVKTDDVENGADFFGGQSS